MFGPQPIEAHHIQHYLFIVQKSDNPKITTKSIWRSWTELYKIKGSQIYEQIKEGL